MSYCQVESGNMSSARLLPHAVSIGVLNKALFTHKTINAYNRDTISHHPKYFHYIIFVRGETYSYDKSRGNETQAQTGPSVGCAGAAQPAERVSALSYARDAELCASVTAFLS